jgi:uncharacterized protein YbjT (DUF2867 family)
MILITGATGMGRSAVVHGVAARDVPVRALTGELAKTERFWRPHAQHAQGDFADAAPLRWCGLCVPGDDLDR